jgi:hypothetical protein
MGADHKGVPMSRTVRMSSRPLVALIPLAALVCATLAGCASQSAAPVVSFPSASAPPALDLDATPTDTVAAQSVAVAESVSAKIADFAGAPVRDYVNGWVTFTVVVSNSSAATVPNIVPLVVFGPCTCDPSSGDVAPHSILQIYDAATGTWTSAASVSSDASGNYTFERQVALETLGAHGSLTYRYRMTLSGSHTGIQDGTGSIEVYVLEQPGHRRVTYTAGPDASVALEYSAS